MKLTRSLVPYTSIVEKDEFIIASEKAFDCASDGITKFYPWALPSMPQGFKLGVIVGSSGSGKTSMLKRMGWEVVPSWEKDKAIISHFKTPDEAISKMGAVGLNSIPSWYKPYHVLSNGEKFRADLSRKLRSHAVIDEFTSVVDRDVAKAASVSLSRYIKTSDIKNVVLATCHRDVLNWLEPDWVIDTDLGEFLPGFFLDGQKYNSIFTKQIIMSGTCLKSITI